MNMIPEGVEHLIVQVGTWSNFLSSLVDGTCLLGPIGIPIAYPRLVFLETALESKFNPLVALGKGGTTGLSGFFNKFNQDAELLDDLVSFYPSLNPLALITG
jgi:hypothetical protein